MRRWPRGYAIALWPGTVAHELLHYLAEHQRRFEDAQSDNQGRVRAVADQVRQLTPLAALIA